MIGETLGSYKIVSVIGQGGMGVVYRAEHTLIGKQVAIKLLLPEMTSDTELVDRFFNEARAAAVIKHPGLVEVFDFGHHTDGSAYIVMELLDGESLGARLARETRLPIATALAIARQVASALHAAHEQQIVHRDLKPENIFLTTDVDAPGGVRTKVLDFGIAKLARTEERRSVKTKTGAVFGTPRYMAPEQCKNATSVDRRADVYALGCIMFEMLLGVAPFDYDNWGELVAAHIHETPPRPSELDPQLPETVEQIVLRALAKKVDDRYPTMLELARHIESVWKTIGDGSRAAMFTPPAGLPVIRRARSEPGAVGDGPTMAAPPARAAAMAPTLPVTGELSMRALPQRSRAWLPLAGGAVVAVALGAFLLLRATSPDEVQPRRTPIASGPASADAAVETSIAPIDAAPEPASARVRLAIDSTPSGAEVYRAADGVKLGKTPLAREYERTDGVAELVIRMRGYRDERVSLATNVDGGRHVKLVRAKQTTTSKPKASGKGSGTTVLDPYK
jgi:eukaryotic-like serine/threonine-protein kinase